MGLEGGIGTLTLQLDEGFPAIHINLYLCLTRSRLSWLQVVENLQQQQTMIIIGIPALAIIARIS